MMRNVGRDAHRSSLRDTWCDGIVAPCQAAVDEGVLLAGLDRVLHRPQRLPAGCVAPPLAALGRPIFSRTRRLSRELDRPRSRLDLFGRCARAGDEARAGVVLDRSSLSGVVAWQTGGTLGSWPSHGEQLHSCMHASVRLSCRSVCLLNCTSIIQGLARPKRRWRFGGGKHIEPRGRPRRLRVPRTASQVTSAWPAVMCCRALRATWVAQRSTCRVLDEKHRLPPRPLLCCGVLPPFPPSDRRPTGHAIQGPMLPATPGSLGRIEARGAGGHLRSSECVPPSSSGYHGCV